MIFNIIYKKRIQVNKHNSLCQQELKECSINTKVGFEEELSMQSNFIKSVQSLSSWSLCESRGAKSLREELSKVRKI